MTMWCMFLIVSHPTELDQCLHEVFFTFKIWKNYFMLLKFVNGWLSFKSWNITTNELEFFINNFTKNIHHFCNKNLIPTSPHFFILVMLIIGRMKYWPTRNPRHATLHFHLLICFYKWLNLGTNSFSLPSNSLQTL